jgi:transmembrane sensor
MKNTTSLSHHPSEDEAALWAARLDGSVLSADDRIALDAWLAEDPAHRTLLSGYCQFSADLEQHLPLLEGIRDQVAELGKKAPAPALPSPWLRWPVWAGVTLAAAAAVAFIFLRPGETQFESFTTPVAQRQALTLADGTMVELNAHTNLQVEIDRANRHVRLASGQAFFTVRKNPAKPFVVETPAGTVRVTGTAFDVRADLGLLEVTVEEGSVQVSPAAATAPTQLTAGSQLTVGAAGTEVRSLPPRELSNALAWRRGQIFFKGVRLDEALARFSRHHGRSLTAAPGAAGLSVGGMFSLDDLEGFLTSMEFMYHVQVKRDPDGAVRVNPPAPN